MHYNRCPNSGVARYGELRHVTCPRRLPTIFFLSSLWSKSDSQLSKYPLSSDI